MIIRRQATDEFFAFRTCQGMDDCGITIVAVFVSEVEKPFMGPSGLITKTFHIIGQADEIDYDDCDHAIETRINQK